MAKKRAKKPGPELEENPSKKSRGKKSLAANKKRRAKRVPRENPAPTFTGEITGVLLPGFVAFAATKTISRITYQLVGKKWPKLAKHANVLAGLATFGAAYWGAERVKMIEPYSDGVVVGTGMAALHTAVQAYLPEKYKFLLSDPRPAELAPPSSAQNNTGIVPPTAAEDEYSFLEEPALRQPRFVAPPPPPTNPITTALTLADDGAPVQFDPDLIEELGGESIDGLYTGSFAQNN